MALSTLLVNFSLMIFLSWCEIQRQSVSEVSFSHRLGDILSPPPSLVPVNMQGRTQTPKPGVPGDKLLQQTRHQPPRPPVPAGSTPGNAAVSVGAPLQFSSSGFLR